MDLKSRVDHGRRFVAVFRAASPSMFGIAESSLLPFSFSTVARVGSGASGCDSSGVAGSIGLVYEASDHVTLLERSLTGAVPACST